MDSKVSDTVYSSVHGLIEEFSSSPWIAAGAIAYVFKQTGEYPNKVEQFENVEKARKIISKWTPAHMVWVKHCLVNVSDSDWKLDSHHIRDYLLGIGLEWFDGFDIDIREYMKRRWEHIVRNVKTIEAVEHEVEFMRRIHDNNSQMVTGKLLSELAFASRRLCIWFIMGDSQEINTHKELHNVHRLLGDYLPRSIPFKDWSGIVSNLDV